MRACLAAAILSLAGNASAGDPAETKLAGQNIVLIVVDCLRADHLSGYGYRRKTSPNIDALAGESALFRQAIAQAPNTLLSFASIFTSKYVSTHGVNAVDKALSDSALTLAEIFKIYDYKTAAFVGGRLLHPIFRLNQGFDDYYHLDYTTASLKDTLPKALAWIEERDGGGDKFFALVHGNDLHMPYAFPAPTVYAKGFKVNARLNSLPPNESQFVSAYKRKLFLRSSREVIDLSQDDVDHTVARYDEGINYVDGLIGGFLDRLRASKLLDRTTIILTADHGEGLFDHDWFFHDYNLYDDTLKVPLIIRIPGMAKMEIQRQVQLIDLMPTMLELAGIKANQDAQGRSLKPLLFGRELGRADPYAFSENFVGGRTARSAEWKLISYPEKVELYDLKNDPAEKTNRAALSAEIARTLKKELDDRLAPGKSDDVSAPLPSSARGFGAGRRRRLFERLTHMESGPPRSR